MSLRFAAFAVLLVGACSCSPDEPRKLNLVIIALDTLRPDHLGCYGYARDTSPNLDLFAKDAVIFENAQTAAPWTAPSLLSLMTSLYPNVHGVWRFSDPGQMNERVTTLAEVLKERGYWTSAFTDGGYAKPQFGLKQGFDTFPLNAGDLPHEHWSNMAHPDRLAGNVDRALKALGEVGDQPFFLFFHTYQVHGPYRPPEELVKRFRPEYDEAAEHARIEVALATLREGGELAPDDVRLVLAHSEHCGSGKGDEKEELAAEIRRHGINSLDEQRMQFWRDLYDAEIRFTDAELKRLLDALDRPGLRENTVVVFVSDHGEGFGEHGITGHGNVLHEEALRVVCMLRAPGVAARRVDDVVSLVDLMPTVLDVLGIERAKLPLQGRGLAPLLRGERLPNAPTFAHALAKTGGEQRLQSVRDGKWRFVFEPETEIGRLFDLEADPKELTDVAGQNPKVVERMRGLLNAQREYDQLLLKKASGPVGNYQLAPSDLEELRKLGYIDVPALPETPPEEQPNGAPQSTPQKP